LQDGWIVPDTQLEDKTHSSYTDGLEYELIMSDEFNRPGRSFKDGHDPLWTGIDKSDDDQPSSGRKSLQFYNHSAISTKDGHLVQSEIIFLFVFMFTSIADSYRLQLAVPLDRHMDNLIERIYGTFCVRIHGLCHHSHSFVFLLFRHHDSLIDQCLREIQFTVEKESRTKST
jgi:Beta-glucan synthesis-associated protein SKN1/KRE6/Sbg1